MLHLDPAERLSRSASLERLQVSELIPESFATLGPIMERVTYSAPDARLAVAAAHYADNDASSGERRQGFESRIW